MNVLNLSAVTMGILWVVVVIVVLVLAVVIWYISTSNTLRRMVVKIEEAESGIDIALTRRFDSLTKAIDTAKGYMKYEVETLEKIISIRKPERSASMEEKQNYSQALNQAAKEVSLFIERYPELKADTQFTAVQRAIAEVEEQLQAARRLYNANVSIYNQKIVTFPSSIVAQNGGHHSRKFFLAEETKREDIKIEF